jgi:hypothetical protein
MIRFDDKGYPVEARYDGGDSAVRIGLLALCGKETNIDKVESYEVTPGMLVRHPIQYPWNNPKNFSRDQLMCYLAGIDKLELRDLAKRIFWSRAKSLFFAQNIERDVPGSTKYPYRHCFARMEDGVEECRNFDFADPLMPNNVWAMIKAARIYWLYPFALIGIPFFVLTLVIHSLGNHYEENQLISECAINGKWAIILFNLINKKWKDVSFKYWSDRDEIEYHNMLVELLDK